MRLVLIFVIVGPILNFAMANEAYDEQILSEQFSTEMYSTDFSDNIANKFISSS